VEKSSFDFAEAIAFGFTTAANNLRIVVLVTLAYFVIVLLVSLILGIIIGHPEELKGELAWIELAFATIIIYIVAGILIMGYVLVALKLVDGYRAHLFDLFACFFLIGRFILASLLVSLAVNAALIPFFIVDSIVGPALWTLILALPGVYVSIRTSFYIFYLVDREVGIVESFTLSWSATEGNVFKLFMLYLLTALIIILGFLLCGVGILFAMPVSILAVACAYRKLSEPSYQGPIYVFQ